MEQENSFPLSEERGIWHFLGQNDIVQALACYLFKINFNIILPSTTRSSKFSLYFRSLHQNIVWVFLRPHTCHMPRPFPSVFDYPNTICWRLQITELHYAGLFPVLITALLGSGGPSALLSRKSSEEYMRKITVIAVRRNKKFHLNFWVLFSVAQWATTFPLSRLHDHTQTQQTR